MVLSDLTDVALVPFFGPDNESTLKLIHRVELSTGFVDTIANADVNRGYAQSFCGFCVLSTTQHATVAKTLTYPTSGHAYRHANKLTIHKLIRAQNHGHTMMNH